MALARSLQFVPPAANLCRNDVKDDFPPYDVVGVVSGTNSQNTVRIADLLNIFKVPMVAVAATTDQVRCGITLNQRGCAVLLTYTPGCAVLLTYSHHNLYSLQCFNVTCLVESKE